MPRGRKKDLTIPPTRSLVQQRDYRARRALYISNLEERCRRVEEENAQLRKELAEARERLVNPAILLPETAAASSELMHHLTLARDALSKFNHLVFPNAQHPDMTLSTSTSSGRQPSSATSSPFASLDSRDANSRGKKELYVDNSCPPYSTPSSSPPPVFSGRSSHDEECCEGWFDCDQLCGDKDDRSTMAFSRTSGMRSTTDLDT